MTRRGFPKQTNDLDSLITEYYSTKQLESEYKNKTGKLNETIKKIMIESNTDKYDSNDCSINLNKRVPQDFNESKAIEILKKNLSQEQLNKVIKTSEYIDETELEELTYSGEFNISLLNCCTTDKEPVYTLRINKNKRGNKQ